MQGETLVKGAFRWISVVALALWITGCATIPPLPPVNTAEPGWQLRQGQALWKPNREAPEIAGEVLLATNPDGRTLLQFTKNPLPFVTVQTSNQLWEIDFVPQQRRFSGKGTPTPRLIWVHLSRALNGQAVRSPLVFTNSTGDEWRLENPRSGETVMGFLNP